MITIAQINTNLYQVDTGYACFGVDTDKTGNIINTAPIGRWMIGKNIKEWTAKDDSYDAQYDYDYLQQ